MYFNKVVRDVLCRLFAEECAVSGLQENYNLGDKTDTTRENKEVHLVQFLENIFELGSQWLKFFRTCECAERSNHWGVFLLSSTTRPI